MTMQRLPTLFSYIVRYRDSSSAHGIQPRDCLLLLCHDHTLATPRTTRPLSDKVTHEEHNHDFFVDIKVHPRIHALAEEQEQSVISSLRAGISAGRIVASLRQSDIVGVIARDIQYCAK